MGFDLCGYLYPDYSLLQAKIKKRGFFYVEYAGPALELPFTYQVIRWFYIWPSAKQRIQYVFFYRDNDYLYLQKRENY